MSITVIKDTKEDKVVESEKRNKSYKDPNEVRRCKGFIIGNGGAYLDQEDYEGKLYCENYDFHGYGVSFYPEDNEIVFIADQGDFMHLPINYYELLGYMFHVSMIGVGVKRSYLYNMVEDN